MVLFDATVLSRLDDTRKKVDRVLFDTGALSANYTAVELTMEFATPNGESEFYKGTCVVLKWNTIT
jgi:hypothetical protein